MLAKKYIITWYTNVMKIGKSVMALGICEKTGNVSFIAAYQPNKQIGQEFLKTLTIHDVYANDNCEDARFCINLDCPLNLVDLGYWKKYGVESIKDLRVLHKRVEQAKNELKLEVKEHGKQIHFAKTPLKIRRK